jgi:hypothetical protein
MKKSICYFTLIALASLSCKKDEPAPVVAPVVPPLSQAAVAGTWKITSAQGVEWQEGVGIVIPLANDPETLNATLVITGTQVTITGADGTAFGTATITIDAANSTATITDLGLFNISAYVGNVSMVWIQHEPNTHSDYSEASPGIFKYFQKYWTLTKQP